MEEKKDSLLIRIQHPQRIVSSVEVITSWILHDGSSPGFPQYKDGIKTPLLEAYCNMFIGKAFELPNSVNGLYDADQLCFREIRPAELCFRLYDDMVETLQHAQLLQSTYDLSCRT